MKKKKFVRRIGGKKNLNFIDKINETKSALLPKRTKLMSRFFAKKNKRLFEYCVILFIALIIIVAIYIAYQKMYADKFFIGTHLADINLGSKTVAEARREILNRTDTFSREGLIIIYQDKRINITASSLATTPDLSFDLFTFDIEKSLRTLFKIGRRNNITKNIKEQILNFILSSNNPLESYLNEEELLSILQDNFHELAKEAQDAEIAFENNEIVIHGEAYGKTFSYEDIIKRIKKQIAYLDNQPITISLRTDYPRTYKAEIEPVLNQAEIILNLAPLKLTAPQDSKKTLPKGWIIEKEQLASLLTTKRTTEGKLFISLKEDDIGRYLEEQVAKFTDLEPVDAKFKIVNDKVAEFRSSNDGQKLNISETFEQLENAIVEAVATTTTAKIVVELVIEEAASAITNEDVNNLGIKEIIGVGKSNFAGSPSNRRHNIRVGAINTLHGVLIKSEEEFSLNKAIGRVAADTGYLPELVIKENKTIPEYGGGLCQIGTTMFRAALGTGLPITERRNHSYRVSYYEPAGTDATIYSPRPDVKFINDTGNYILIQSWINGDDLYFEFWGTKDGRGITQTKPKIYNITKPPPTKFVITSELTPEEKKCTEHAHNGADTSFYYKVEYPDGEIKEQTFTSHYRPWQEVCLIGATSTPETVDINDEVEIR